MSFSARYTVADILTGKPVDLPPQSEEVAGFYAAMLNTDHAENDVFKKNFFNDFKKILKDWPPVRFSLLYSMRQFSIDSYIRNAEPISLALKIVTLRRCLIIMKLRKPNARL